MRKAALHNLGCKVNAYETEAMARLLREAGYEIVPFTEKADVYVINTCTVTNIADKKSRQMIHRARKNNPDAVVVAAGCYVQMAAEKLKADGAADVIIGNNRKKEIVGILEEFIAERAAAGAAPAQPAGAPGGIAGGENRGSEITAGAKTSETGIAAAKIHESKNGTAGAETRESEITVASAETHESKNGTVVAEASENEVVAVAEASENEVVAVAEASENEIVAAAKNRESKIGTAAAKTREYEIDIASTREYETLSVSGAGGHARAFIKIQDGCSQFCSYCIIPYARGRVRSRAAAEIVKEAETLVRAGYREIVLTGIHISSYGLDMPEAERVSLLSLLEMLDGVDGLVRLRLGSLEPRIVTEEFARRIAALKTVCPHFHLSLQSGCDATLKRMNRHYMTEEYAGCCRLLRGYFDRPAITTDVIVGFPGETEEEFAQTVSFIRKIGFYELHVFPYSRREGTRAAQMPDQVDESVKKERSACLLELNREASLAYRRSWLGEEREVLLEEEVVVNGVRYLAGHTREYVKAAVPLAADVPGIPDIPDNIPGILSSFPPDAMAFPDTPALPNTPAFPDTLVFPDTPVLPNTPAFPDTVVLPDTLVPSDILASPDTPTFRRGTEEDVSLGGGRSSGIPAHGKIVCGRMEEMLNEEMVRIAADPENYGIL